MFKWQWDEILQLWGKKYPYFIRKTRAKVLTGINLFCLQVRTIYRYQQISILKREQVEYQHVQLSLDLQSWRLSWEKYCKAAFPCSFNFADHLAGMEDPLCKISLIQDKLWGTEKKAHPSLFCSPNYVYEGFFNVKKNNH